MNQPSEQRKKWIDLIEEDEIAFIKKLILFSGSLTDVATAYDTTLSTVQVRLKRLISKIKILDDTEIQDDFERHLRNVYAEKRLDSNNYKQHLAALADLEIISNSMPTSNGNGHGAAKRAYHSNGTGKHEYNGVTV